MYRTDMYEGLLAETITMAGANGDTINAYLASDTCPLSRSIRARTRA